MSSARSRNKFCLSLDTSPSNASSNTAEFSRWSEVVPPKTALTFAALWDPDEGMVTFSGAALLEPEGLSRRSDLDDDYSQFFNPDRDTDGDTTPDDNAATLSTFRDVFSAFLRHRSWDSREHLNMKSEQSAPRGLQTCASSTFDGLDVYSHDVQKPRRSVQLSCIDLLEAETSFRAPSAFGRLRLRSDLMLDSYRSEPESESGSESRPPHLKSRFSTTTTSTSNYVDIPGSASQSVHIPETLPVPEWAQSKECISPAGSWPFLPHRRGVLRKRRPFDRDTITTVTSSAPATPRKLLPSPFKSTSTSTSPFSTSPSSRLSSSSALTAWKERRGRFPRRIGRLVSLTSTPPNTPSPSPSKSARLKLRFAFLQKRKQRQTSPDSDGWVCIEVTPIIRQHFIADSDLDEC